MAKDTSYLSESRSERPKIGHHPCSNQDIPSQVLVLNCEVFGCLLPPVLLPAKTTNQLLSSINRCTIDSSILFLPPPPFPQYPHHTITTPSSHVPPPPPPPPQCNLVKKIGREEGIRLGSFSPPSSLSPLFLSLPFSLTPPLYPPPSPLLLLPSPSPSLPSSFLHSLFPQEPPPPPPPPLLLTS